MKTRVLRLAAVGCVLSLAIAGTSVAVRLSSPAAADSAGSVAAAPPADPLEAAVRTAERLVQGRAAELKAASADAFIRQQAVTTPWGLQYVSYERTYQDLPVIGGDFVVTTDAQGNTRGLAVAQQQAINVSRQPTVAKAVATRTARATLDSVFPGPGEPTLVVYAGAKKPALAWEVVVKGKDDGEPTHQKVYVDARNGKVLYSVELTATGTGTGAWNGANLAIGSTKSGSTFTMADPNRPNLRCGDLATGKTYTGPDDVWGTASKTSREAACVDVMHAAAGQWDLLKQQYGRNGLDGKGSWADALVGMQDENAHWDGPYNPGGTAFGYTRQREWATQIDIVAHEYGHGLDAMTPGGISGYPSQEAVADIWGALTEAFLNNPNDTPDYEVGERVSLVGKRPRCPAVSRRLHVGGSGHPADGQRRRCRCHR